MIEVMFWHDACFYLASEEPMTIETAEKILNQHSINWRIFQGQLQIEDCSTFDGILYSMYVPCPLTRHDLMAWLGY